MSKEEFCKLYAYVALEKIIYDDLNDKTNKKTHFEIEENEVFYVGVSKNISERDMMHKAFSRYKGKDGQVINRLLQDNENKYTLVGIDLIATIIHNNKKIEINLTKKQIHKLELTLIDMFDSKVNIYGKGV